MPLPRHVALLAHWAEDLSTGALAALRIPFRPLGNRFARLTPEQSRIYLEQILQCYQHYARTPVRGRVCEIGPGNTLGMAVLLAREGAREVHFVDRFPLIPGRDDDALCRDLFARAAARFAERGLTYEQVAAAVHRHSGMPVEEFFARGDAGRFDFIASNAVLEHLSDPLGALDRMYERLSPGGAMVHIVDLRGHALFKSLGPLEWLKTPRAWHARLVRHTARPNRVLVHEYRDWARAHPGAEIHLRGWVGHEEYSAALDGSGPAPEILAAASAAVEAQRAGFAAEFHAVATADLAVTVFALVVRKPV